MVVEVFQNTNLTGATQSFTAQGNGAGITDVNDFRGTTVGNNPSSIRLASGDAVLLCAKQNWGGEVMYLRDQRMIRDLGDPSVGGRRGFRNTVRSARFRPFLVELNISVVTGDDGTLPGGWPNRPQVESDLDDLIDMLNDFFRRERALIRVARSDVTYRPSERFYNVSVQEYRPIPGRWKKQKKVDVVFVNRITGAVGVSSYPWHGKHVLMAADRDNGGPGFSRLDKIARTWAHELGHFWSLRHQSPVTQAMIDALALINPTAAAFMTLSNDNIMIPSRDAGPFNAATLSMTQLNSVHQVLARNLQRKRDRIDVIDDNLI